MQIVKAEILWTRTCSLRCHYCKMGTGQSNSRPSAFWQEGLDNLKMLGCPFIAIYGAEPLSDFEKLPDFIHYASEIGMDMTLITSGVTGDPEDKLRELYKQGLRSLTVSYDMIPLDSSSRAKTDKALHLLDFFQSLGPVDNIAVVVTLTRQNFEKLPMTIIEMSSEGIWTFFDIIHPDRGQEGSKCARRDESLLFRKGDLHDLRRTLTQVQNLKNSGLLVHASKAFLEGLIRSDDIILKYSWNCGDYDCFPSWVTVNCDGLVYPCDDFQPKGRGIPLNELYEQWPVIKGYWQGSVFWDCPGCAWNTHIDAHNIKSGIVPVTDYIHKGK